MNQIEENRSRALLAKAKILDMEYNLEDEFGLFTLLKDFKLFRRGSRRTIYHLMSEARHFDTKTYIFDYKYVIGNNNKRTHKKQTVLFLNSKKLSLPQFRMEPEQLWHKLTTWLQIESDIDFVEYPQFSDQYLLKGEDEDLIRHVFSREVLDFFSIHKNWHIEGEGFFLIFYSHNERFHPEVIPGFYKMGINLLRLFETRPGAFEL